MTPASAAIASPFKNAWYKNCSDEQQHILEDYAQRLEDLEQTYHLKLLSAGMDALESTLRIVGVNESDP